MKNRAKRDDSSQHQFRSRVLSDVLDKVRGELLVIDLKPVGGHPGRRVSVRIGETVKFSLKRRDADIATAHRLQALAHLEKR